MKNWKKVVACLLFATLMVMGTMLFTSCGEEDCNHVWADATCLAPKTCILCDATEGEALGHTGGIPTCTSLGICTRCGEGYGELSAHTPAEDDGDCTTPVLCTGCDKVMTSAQAAHTPAEDDGNCSTPILCTVCGGTTTSAKEHLYGSDCDTDCNNIGCTYTRTVTHSYTVSLPADEFIKTPASCKASAVYYKSCACGAKGAETFTYGDPIAHTPKAARQENVVNPTCGAPGSYDEVIHCLDCDDVISTEKKTIAATGNHTPGVPVRKNEVAATCGKDGSYDEVVSCTVCKNEISTTKKTVSATGNHTPKAAIEEGRVEATCGVAGSYNEVVYCRDCNHKISTVLKTIPATGNHTPADDDGDCTTAVACTTCGGIATPAKSAHTPKEAVKENEKLPTCGEAGSYESVVYCAECNKQIRRETVTVQATGNHTAAEAVKENEIAGDCGKDGSYDSVVYCSDCSHEISRETKTVAATGIHTPAADDHDCTTALLCSVCEAILTPAAEGHTPAEDDGDCTTDILCTVCGKVAEAGKAAHTPAEAVKENEVAGDCGTAGSYESVVYCTVCDHEISRETKTVAATGNHTPAEDDGNCTTAVSCTVCGGVAVAGKEDHTAGDSVNENEKAPTCGEAGSHESVVYCTVCGTEISRETVTDPATGTHVFDKEVEAVTYLKASATCESAAVYYKSCVCGAYDEEKSETFTVGKAVDCAFTDEVVAPEYLKSAATCRSAAIYHKTCIWCHEKGGEGDVFTDGEPKAHTFTAETVDPKYIHTVANCESAATYFKSCESCGLKGEETFTFGEKAACVFENELAEDRYLKEAATCESAAIYYKSCTGCGEQGGEGDTFVFGEPLPHSYTEEVVSDEFLKNEADCENAAVYYKSCACGHFDEIVSETFENGEALGHRYNDGVVTEATCTEAKSTLYTCLGCVTTYPETEGTALGHDILNAKLVREEQIGDSCEYRQFYACNTCGEEAEGQTATKHIYTASITTLATCQAEGLMTYTCVCADSYTTAIPANEGAHNWVGVNGSTENFACSHCGATKTVVDKSTETEALVNKDSLADSSLQLKDAEIKLDADILASDELKDATDLTIGANTMQKEDLPEGVILSEEQKNQIGDNPIYDFSMKNGDTVISEFKDAEGNPKTITITIPYTIKADENADSIFIWFINDQGGVEAIKATYNEIDGQGYVSFETAHFSYYSVTRLTEEEQCEFYDEHIETTITVEATCTSGGYILHICTRCGHTYKSNEVPALSHNYEKDEEKSTAPTCKEFGTDFFACETCRHTYTVTLAKLPHSYTDTVVEPTCDKMGYTSHECSSCGNIYRDGFTAALKHAYEIEWSWNEDETEATVTFTCQNDAEHTETKRASVIVRNIPATCRKEGLRGAEASVFFNGKTYSDSKLETIEALPHEYAYTLYDGSYHWTACLCGAPLEGSEEKHTVASEVILSAATCQRMGEKLIACDCGFKTTESIDKVDHRYVSGTCTMCGAVDGDCDHTPSNKGTLDLSVYGCCQDSLSYTACDCGEVVVMDMEDLMRFPCAQKMGQPDEGNYGGQGSPEEPMWMRGVCPDCGIELYVEMVQVGGEDSCYRYISYVMTLSKDGSIIVENATAEYEETYHGTNEMVTVDLAELGFCGGMLMLYQCEDCKEYTEIYRLQPDCKSVKEDGGPVIIDGVPHMIMTKSCDDCGLYLEMDMYEVKLNACEIYYYTTYTMNKGDETLYTVRMQEYEGNHEWEYEYTFKDEALGCEGGIRGDGVCKNCGQTTWYTTSGHRFEKLSKIDISEYNCCGAELTVVQCAYCEESTYMDSPVGGCSWRQAASSTDENGVNTQLFICDNCGFMRVEIHTPDPEKSTGCVVYYDVTATFVKGEGEEAVTVYTYGYSVKKDNHERETTYTFMDPENPNCDGGYRYVKTCKNCGETISESGYGHRYESLNENLYVDGKECKGIRINGEWCPVCEKVNWLNVWMDCPFTSSDTPYVDANGIAHDVTIRTCNECGYVVKEDTYILLQEGCHIAWETIYTVTLNGETVYTVTVKQEEDRHNYEYDYKLRGETCDAGYDYVATCTLCSDRYERSGYGHNYYYEKIDLSELGVACGGYIDRRGCRICGEADLVDAEVWLNCHLQKEGESSTYTGEDGYLHTSETYSCQQCGLTVTYDSYVVPRPDIGPCDVYAYRTTLLFMNEEVIATVTRRQDEQRHTMTYTYEYNDEALGCEGGFVRFSSCKDCGNDFGRFPFWDHHYETETIYLREYGACGGEIYVNRCHCGKVSNITYNPLCKVTTTPTEKGHTQTCDVCKSVYCFESYTEVKNECQTVTYFTATLTVDGREAWQASYELEEKNHVYTITDVVLQKGSKTCNDGVILTYTCVCGYSYESYGAGHHLLTVTSYDLSEYGSRCGSVLYEKACVCGAQRELELDDECVYEHVGCDAFVSDYIKGEDASRSEFFYNDYDKHLMAIGRWLPTSFYTLTCAADNCGSAVRHATYWVHDPETCMATEYILYQLGYDAEDGSYEKEVLMATGRVEKWHEYEHEQYTNVDGGRDVCACGSYVDVRHGWSECDCGEGGHKEECTTYRNTTTVILVNTRYSDIPSLVQTVCTYNQKGETVKQVTTYTDEDGESHTVVTEVTYGVYTPEIDLPAIFDGCGLVLKETITTLDSVRFRQYYKNAYLEYNGNRYNLMDYTEYYREDGTLESWYKALFEYRFGETCEYRHITSGSDREDHEDEYWQNCCHGSWNTVKDPDCTQDGLRQYLCIVCKNLSSEETISPGGHNFEWKYVEEEEREIYVCTRCGLESATGVNGTVTFEDLSDESSYIIGYYVGENEHSYMPVVHVVVDGQTVEILDIPIGESVEIRAHVIARGAVEQAVNALIDDGKLSADAEYELRFQYRAIDGTQPEFLYAITLTK